MSGRNTGSLMGREPTGKEFAVRHTYIWRIAGDKIVEHWGSRDDLGLLGQLGFLQMREEPEANLSGLGLVFAG
jgi:predicted ester cyclase